MDNAILNKLMNLLISLAHDVVVPPLIEVCTKPFRVLSCQIIALEESDSSKVT